MTEEDAKGATEGRRIERGGFRLSDRLVRNARKFLVIKGSIDGLAVEHVRVEDVGVFLDGDSNSSLVNAAITDVTARAMGTGFSRLRGDSHDVVFRDVSVVQGDGDAGGYPCGFKLDGRARAITYERCTVNGFHVNQPADKYWNGDGFADERENASIRYLNCEAQGASDGGFDSKSTDSVFESCTAGGNKRNFRGWGSGRLTAFTSETPRHFGGSGGAAHFWFGGDQPRYVLNKPIIRARPGDRTPIFVFDTKQPAIIEIHDADIEAPDALLIKVDGGVAPQIAWDWSDRRLKRKMP